MMFDSSAIDTIKKQLTAQKQTIAVAESVTAGLLQAALASAIEASQFFQGGITCYNLGQKCRHLDIDPIHASGCNCVSDKMAEDMARNVCDLFSSDWGIGITGYASPMPEVDNQLFAHFAISFRGEIKLSDKVETDKEDPLEAQLFYVDHIISKMEELAAEVKGKPQFHCQN